MNEIITAIRDRRSCRKFKADMPSSADLDQIVEAGLYAASGRGRQASIVLKVTNKELRDRLSAMNARIWGKPGDIDPFLAPPPSSSCSPIALCPPMCTTVRWPWAT